MDLIENGLLEAILRVNFGHLTGHNLKAARIAVSLGIEGRRPISENVYFFRYFAEIGLRPSILADYAKLGGFVAHRGGS
jgi:hypothetical protein